MLMPGRPAPALSLPTLDGGRFELESQEGWTLLVFYRGLHCPICIRELAALGERRGELEALGASVLAISADDEARARMTREKAGAEALPVAHSLSLTAASQDWGLWISAAREGSEEPALFSEPGHFIVAPDGTIWAAWVQSAPFARPAADDLVGALRFAVEKGYPPRGAFEGALPSEAA